MSNSPTNIRVGPCRVRFGGRDVGLTKGGVDVELKTTTKLVQVDQFGNTPVDEYITGRELTVKCPFAETDLDSIYAMLKNSQTAMIDTSGVKATGSFTFTANPIAGDTLNINGAVYTFETVVAFPPTADNQILIGATPIATAANIVSVLQESSNPLVLAATYTASPTAGTVNVTAFQSGTAGNAITLSATLATQADVTVVAMTGGVNTTMKRVEIYTGIGESLMAVGQTLVLHPQNKNDDDQSEDFVVPIANTSGAFTLAYKLDQERVFNLTFTGYPDSVTKRLCYYGAGA